MNEVNIPRWNHALVRLQSSKNGKSMPDVMGDLGNEVLGRPHTMTHTSNPHLQDLPSCYQLLHDRAAPTAVHLTIRPMPIRVIFGPVPRLVRRIPPAHLAMRQRVRVRHPARPIKRRRRDKNIPIHPRRQVMVIPVVFPIDVGIPIRAEIERDIVRERCALGNHHGVVVREPPVVKGRRCRDLERITVAIVGGYFGSPQGFPVYWPFLYVLQCDCLVDVCVADSCGCWDEHSWTNAGTLHAIGQRRACLDDAVCVGGGFERGGFGCGGFGRGHYGGFGCGGFGCVPREVGPSVVGGDPG